MSRLRTDPDSLRCFVCHARCFSWAEVAEHEDECVANAAEDLDAEADDHADRQRRARIDDKLTGDL